MQGVRLVKMEGTDRVAASVSNEGEPPGDQEPDNQSNLPLQ